MDLDHVPVLPPQAEAVGRSLPEIRAALRARLPGIGLPADLALASIDHLYDHPGSTLRFVGAPICYYANHQTSYESFLIAFLHLAVTGVKLLAVTHPGLFDNDYGEHCMLMAEQLRRLNHPAADAIQVVAVPHEVQPARRCAASSGMISTTSSRSGGRPASSNAREITPVPAPISSTASSSVQHT